MMSEEILDFGFWILDFGFWTLSEAVGEASPLAIVSKIQNR
jgi:hypothetical protein